MDTGWLVDRPLFVVGSHVVERNEVLIAVAVALVLCVLLRARRRTVDREPVGKLARTLDARLAEMQRLQAETSGRLAAVSEVFGSRQADIDRALAERLDGLGVQLGQSMVATTRSTQESLAALSERLAVIDGAQTTIGRLATQVSALERIFTDKQQRGAFGEARMEAIVSDALPAHAVRFQATLSNGRRPDCLIRLPHGAPPLVIDAKFPLEGWTRLSAATDEAAYRRAQTLFRRDLMRHIDDVQSAYLIPGETQRLAFIFIPSEAIFAEIAENFGDVVQRGYRLRVVLLSPTLLSLAIQLVGAMVRDARIEEEAHIIQTEVRQMMDDVGRLLDRIGRLTGHVDAAAREVGAVELSARKIARRGERIESLEAAPPRSGSEQPRGRPRSEVVRLRDRADKSA